MFLRGKFQLFGLLDHLAVVYIIVHFVPEAREIRMKIQKRGVVWVNI